MIHARRAAAALAASVLSACASAPTVRHVRPVLPPPAAVEKVPARLGVHYEPAFSRFWMPADVRGNGVAVGEDSVAMLDEILPLVADSVAPMAGPAPLAAPAPAVDFVLEPSIEHFELFAFGERPGDLHAIVYRMSLFDPGGALVWTWTVEGRVPYRPAAEPQPAGYQPPGMASATYQAEKDGVAHATENLADAARRLLASFPRDSRIAEWRARRASGQPVALEGVTVEAVVEDLEVGLPGLPPTLSGAGVVAVKVRVANRGAAPVPLAGIVGRVALADGRTVHAPAPSVIVRRLQLASAAVGAGYVKRLGNLFGPIAAVAHHAKLNAALPTRRAALEERALRPATLAPGASVEGHLYFLPQYGGYASGAATLSLWLVDAEQRSLRATLPLQLIAPPPPKPEPEPDAQPGTF